MVKALNFSDPNIAWEDFQTCVAKKIGRHEDKNNSGSLSKTPQEATSDEKPSPPLHQCYESLAEYGHVRESFKFWLEGVCIAIVGAFGLCGNIVTGIVLKGMTANSNFNKLLIR